MSASARAYPQTPAVLFLGSAGPFSAAVFRHLLTSGACIRGIVRPGFGERLSPDPDNPRALPVSVSPPDEMLEEARVRRIPVRFVRGMREGAVHAWMAGRAPDIVIAACFPYILPSPVLALPAHGCLNLHPSPLPRYRGPAPLFWQFRAGEREGAITLHRMAERVDGGDIIARRTLPVPAGTTAGALNARLAEAGGCLAVEALAALGRGAALAAQRQCEAAASYFSMPSTKDFRISRTWSAERAFRFIRGTREWGMTYLVRTGGGTVRVRDALGFAVDERLAVPVQEGPRGLRIGFAHGVLHVVPE